MTRLTRRRLIASALAVPMTSSIAWGQASFPNRPLRIIVPLQAGGSADVGTRLIATSLQNRLKQPVIVDNKPGGSYVIGMQAVTSSAADGHTLIAVNTGMMAAQATLQRYDMLKSLAPISQTGQTPVLFVVSAKSRFGSISELISFAKANPGKLNFGSVGAGGLEHLWVAMFSRAMGIEVTHIPFKGMPDAITALAQGELDFVPCVMSVAAPFVEKGVLRALGVISDKRLPAMPELPTVREQGANVPPMEFWSGIAAPKGTPAAIVEQLRRELTMVMNDPEMKQKMASRGTTVVTSQSPVEFATVMEADLAWMKAIVKAANIHIE